MLQIADDDAFGEIQQNRFEPAFLLRPLILRLGQCLGAACFGARQPTPHRVEAFGELSQPVARAQSKAMTEVLAGDDPNIEGKAIERSHQAMHDEPGKREEDRQQHAAGRDNRTRCLLAEGKRKHRETDDERCCKADEQSADDSGHGLVARHGQPRRSSMRRTRSTSSRVENGFVTYSSAPSESPFSRCMSPPLAVSMMMRMSRQPGLLRISWQTP